MNKFNTWQALSCRHIWVYTEGASERYTTSKRNSLVVEPMCQLFSAVDPDTEDEETVFQHSSTWNLDRADGDRTFDDLNGLRNIFVFFFEAKNTVACGWSHDKPYLRNHATCHQLGLNQLALKRAFICPKVYSLKAHFFTSWQGKYGCVQLLEIVDFKVNILLVLLTTEVWGNA